MPGVRLVTPGQTFTSDDSRVGGSRAGSAAHLDTAMTEWPSSADALNARMLIKVMFILELNPIRWKNFPRCGALAQLCSPNCLFTSGF